MAPSPQPDIFIIGAPRSGTTWLQRILGLHPGIATPRETHLVHHFLGPFEAAWQRQREAHDRSLADYKAKGGLPLTQMGGIFGGLPSLLTGEEFYEAMRVIYGRQRDRALELKPGATTFLEKTPSNSLHVELLARLAPECQFIHIVRDPADAIASLLEASRGWGQTWMPNNADGASREYREHVAGALQAKRFGSRYQELRYEDLVHDTPNQIFSLLTRLGICASREQCVEMVEEANRGRGGPGSGRSPFVGINSAAIHDATASASASASSSAPGSQGQSGAPKRQLTEYERWCVERETRDLMHRFGYSGEDHRRPACEKLYRGRRIVDRLWRGARYELRRIKLNRTKPD